MIEYDIYITTQTHSLAERYKFSNELVFNYTGINDVPYLEAGMRGSPWNDSFEVLFVATEGNKVVGSLVLHVGGEDRTWVSSVGVHPDYQNQGIATNLIEMFFQFVAQEVVGTVVQSSYTKQGMEYISPIFDRIHQQYRSVDFVDEKKKLHR